MEDNRLKQRIVGAIVLVSLAVIFIPMILTGSKDTGNSPAETNIPEKPERDFVSRIIPLDRQAPQPAPLLAEPPAAVPTPSKTPAPEAAAPSPGTAASEPPAVTPAPAEPAVNTVPQAAPAPVVAKTVSAWVVQVGVFSSKDNAYALRDKLRKQGFDAFVDPQHEGDTTAYRVRVGPEVKRESAEATQATLQKSAGLKGFVTKYP